MANKKISELPAVLGANVVDADILALVHAAASSSLTIGQLKLALASGGGSGGKVLAFLTTAVTMNAAGTAFTATIPANTFKTGDIFETAGWTFQSASNNSNYYTTAVKMAGNTLTSITSQYSLDNFISTVKYIYDGTSKTFIPLVNALPSGSAFSFDGTVSQTFSVAVTVTGAPGYSLLLKSLHLTQIPS